MKVLKVFFAGLLYGWFMKWIIDEIFVRDKYRMITNENAELRERIQFLEAIKPPQTVSPPPAPRSQPLQPVEPALEPVAPVEVASDEPDDLKLIKGIGPQLEKKLNNAGITTFEQMSRLTTTDLQNILGISKRVTQNADNLISQAKKFARENSRR